MTFRIVLVSIFYAYGSPENGLLVYVGLLAVYIGKETAIFFYVGVMRRRNARIVFWMRAADCLPCYLAMNSLRAARLTRDVA
jgi:hypothetical protein